MTIFVVKSRYFRLVCFFNIATRCMQMQFNTALYAVGTSHSNSVSPSVHLSVSRIRSVETAEWIVQIFVL